jgi:hypothetical protein
MNELPFNDNILNSVLHESLKNKSQDELDREIYGRFVELIVIAKDFVLTYNYDKGVNRCKATRGVVISLKALAVLLAFAGTNSKDTKQIVALLNMDGASTRKLSRYVRRFKKIILAEYSGKIKV